MHSYIIQGDMRDNNGGQCGGSGNRTRENLFIYSHQNDENKFISVFAFASSFLLDLPCPHPYQNSKIKIHILNRMPNEN
jgi:hypothetical protein